MPEVSRAVGVVSLETLDFRVSALEEGFHAIRKDMGDAVREIQSNTALTEQIQGTLEEVKGDTAGIVAATKWASTTKRALFALCVATGSFCAAALGAIKLAHQLGWLN